MPPTSDAGRTGGCACGAIRFTISGPFIATGACHCTDCQKTAGGGPNYVVLVPPGALTIEKGTPRTWLGHGDSGAEVGRSFCADCGTPLWAGATDGPFITVKIGALDDSSDFTPALHVYAASAPAWHPMDDGLPRFEKMPPAG